MRSFAPNPFKKKELDEIRKHPPNHSNKPPTTPYLRLYTNILQDPKPTDLITYVLINCLEQIPPQLLQDNLNRNKLPCTVGVFMDQPEGNRNLLVLLQAPNRMDVVSTKIRIAVEAIKSDKV